MRAHPLRRDCLEKGGVSQEAWCVPGFSTGSLWDSAEVLSAVCVSLLTPKWQQLWEDPWEPGAVLVPPRQLACEGLGNSHLR